MEKNIQKSANKITTMYKGLSYFDQYGSSVILFIILTIIVFLVYAYCAIMYNVQPIKDNWMAERCNPKVIPFAGLINRPKDKTISEFTGENFTFCVQNILTEITGFAVQPLTYITHVLQQIYSDIMVAINDIRNMLNYVRNSFEDITREIMGRLMNIMPPLQQLIIGLRDIMGKIKGVLTAGLMTSLATYYSLKSLLGAIVEFIVLLLVILVGLIFVEWLGIFSIPFAIINTAIFLAISIPLIIMMAFMNEVLDIHSSAVPGLKKPSLSCFDKNTKFKMFDGKIKHISKLNVGDRLVNGDLVTAFLKLERGNWKMYNLNNVIVSECHKVLHREKMIPVSEHPEALLVEKYSEPFIYCINTTSKEININGLIFVDWDELYDDKLEAVLHFIKMKKEKDSEFAIEIAEPINKDVHLFMDGGFSENTLVTLKNRMVKKIKDVQINDILEHGETIYGIVEIDGKNIQQRVFHLGIHTFEGGHKLNFNMKNLGNSSTLQMNFDKYPVKENKKLYHLLTDVGSFKIGEVQFSDYNSCVEALF